MNLSSFRVLLVRHGETEWSRSGQHTSRTEIALTDAGRVQAETLRATLAGRHFSLVLTSPRSRATETARLAGVGDEAEVDPNLAEWDYGDYEGVTTATIRHTVPGWTVWTHPCPHGETADQVAARADKVLDRARTALATGTGDVLLVAHGHFLRVVAARWLGLDASGGRYLLLEPATISQLGYEHETPVVAQWNAPPSP